MDDDNRQDAAPREFGIQPLDAILRERGISNHDLVAASAQNLTHKVVGKGRKGRRLTRNAQGKIADALNALAAARDPAAQPIRAGELFNYPGA